jgi:TolB-like protein/cytochrome c-type biogenesis protein CcmH/NrfG/predicted Ser/Thr protein kinase
MISALRLCPKCGWEIPADAPDGGCPGCLLESGLRLLDEEAVAEGADLCHIDKPARGTRSERLAQTVGELGDYELQEEVGRGGQGVVFRARQRSLNRTVALKVVSLGQWASEAHLKRFRREAHAAASLDHPSIVPIYEVGERDGSCYFSMKFVEGGQLDEVVRRTPMSIRQAAELIAKVARTVHYAHEHGILHRDIKPGNILLDQQGEPHLTDFGLARLVESESTVTRTLEVLGTPSYMAPEQATGNNTHLTSATDVYGLGAVLYQLLTGHPPFAGGTTYETIKLLIDTDPRPPRVVNPKIDRELSAICLKCLEKDPTRRYCSALALAEDLEHWLKHEPIQAKPSGFFTHARKWVRRNQSTAVLVTLLVALALGVSVILWNRQPPVLIPKSVAVLPFENLSDDPNNAYFADGIQEEILTRLANISDLKVISRTSTKRYQSKPANLAETAKQLGVANIVEGSVQKAANQVRVNVQLINAQTDSHLWADTYDRKLTDVLGVENEIAKGIAESLRVKLTGHEEQALAAKPTNNSEAYDAYLHGLALEARTAPSASWDTRSFYDRAVRLDPNFTIAWARLSRSETLLYMAHDDTHGSLTARADAAKIALKNAQRLEPDSPETLLTLGYYQYRVLRDYGAAKTTFGRVANLSPSNSEAPYALARVARRETQWDESLAYFEKALALDPRNLEVLNAAAFTYAALKQFSPALKLYDRVLDIRPNEPDTMANKARIYQAEGNLQEAARLLSGINETSSSAAFETKTAQLQFERNYGELVRLQQARLTQKGAGFMDQLNMATYQRLAGDTAGARVTARQAYTTLEPLYQKSPDNYGYAACLSRAHAFMGEKDLALQLAQRAVVLKARDKDVGGGASFEENLALIQTIVDENDRAISTLTHLLKVGPYESPNYGAPALTPALLRLDPLWDPLRSDPAFQKLCEEEIDKSIAVLPFDNLSGDPNNVYFAEGIQEEILARLGKISDLKVISRTSTKQYESKPGNLGEIAKQLGVTNILEGSVQKAADQVRVNVQLINAQTDSHMWAETYDRKLTDVFNVESEIAKGIAESLQIKLTGREEQALAVKPTNNPEAYDAYLRGLTFESHMYDAEIAKAVDSYERAVRLDPNFAFAWARLSRIYSNRYFTHEDATPARRDAAKRALENSQKLAPNSPETLLALGYYQYYVLLDYGAAKTTLQRVSEMLPGNSEAPYALGRLARREGHWDEGISYFDRALSLDPRNVELLSNATATYLALRQFPPALKLLDRMLDITPNDPGIIARKVRIYQAQGNLQEAARSLSGINWQNRAEVVMSDQLTYERNYGEAIRFLQAQLSRVDVTAGEKFDYLGSLSMTQRFAGDTANAKVTAEQVFKILEPLSKDEPDSPSHAMQLALCHALLQEKDSALKLAERAVMLRPRSKDAASGPTFEESLAIVQVLVGENSRAISNLTQLLQTPYFGSYYGTPVTPALLRLDPIWDPLRSDPAFQQLCEEKQK